MSLLPTNQERFNSENTRISPAALQQLHQRLRSLEENEILLRRILGDFSQMVEGIQDAVTFIEGGKVTYANRRSQEFFGPPDSGPVALLGFNIAASYERERLESVIEQIHGSGIPPDEIQFWIQKPDGNQICLLHRYTPMIRDGQVVGRYVITSDVTERARHERELQAIVSISSALRKASSLQEMYSILVKQTQELVHADSAALLILDPIMGDLEVELSTGDWGRWTKNRIPAGKGLSHHVVSTGRPFYSTTPQAEERILSQELVSGLRSIVCMPLIVQNRAIGALWVGSHGVISPAEFDILKAIADIAANALHRASAHEETLANVQRLQALRTIDMAITSSLDLSITLDILLDQVITQLKVDAANVLLFRSETQCLERTASRGFQKEPPLEEIPMAGSLPGKIVLDRRTVEIPDLEASPPDLSIFALNYEAFQAYLAVPLIAKGIVKGVLEVFHRTPIHPDPAWIDYLEALGTQAAIAVDSSNLFQDLQRSNLELTQAYDATLEGWSRALDLRDKETEGHTQRVTRLTVELSQMMGIRGDELIQIRRGALLHDIGKMGIPDNILRKAGPLTEEEWELMRQHPIFAYDLLAPIPYLRPALAIPYWHHERWNGSGYPSGLKGDAIPLPARIFAVIDVWDALCSDRPYRTAWSEEKALNYLREHAGTHFDPLVVERFIQLILQTHTQA